MKMNTHTTFLRVYTNTSIQISVTQRSPRGDRTEGETEGQRTVFTVDANVLSGNGICEGGQTE